MQGGVREFCAELRVISPLRVSEERQSGKAELAGLLNGLEIWVGCA